MPKRRFTIAMPVHNGGDYLKSAIASCLAQRYADFDLAVLDNASDDGSSEWLLNINDHRLNIVRSDKLLSIEDNWRRIIEIKKSEFLTILAHDDLLDPDFLTTINTMIDRHPSGALFHTHYNIIDSEGCIVRPCLPMPFEEGASEFAAARFCNIRDSFSTGYVMRSNDYDAAGGIPPYAGLIYADDALWITMLRGHDHRKYTSPGKYFSYRQHRDSAQHTVAPTLLAAFEQYVYFLCRELADDASFRDFVMRYVAPFVHDCVKCIYGTALRDASLQRSRVDGDILIRLSQIIQPLSQERVNDIIRGDTRLRLLNFVNRLPVRHIVHKCAHLLDSTMPSRRTE